MKRVLIAGMCLTTLAGCDVPGLDGGAHATPGTATDLVDAMAANNRLPQREYICTLTGGGPETDMPYGTIGVNADTFTAIIKQAGRQEGLLRVDENRRIEVEGDLAVVDGEVRRIRSARVNSEDTTLELAFDFAPADSEGRDQIVCRAEA